MPLGMGRSNVAGVVSRQHAERLPLGALYGVAWRSRPRATSAQINLTQYVQSDLTSTPTPLVRSVVRSRATLPPRPRPRCASDEWDWFVEALRNRYPAASVTNTQMFVGEQACSATAISLTAPGDKDGRVRTTHQRRHHDSASGALGGRRALAMIAALSLRTA